MPDPDSYLPARYTESLEDRELEAALRNRPTDEDRATDDSLYRQHLANYERQIYGEVS